MVHLIRAKFKEFSIYLRPIATLDFARNFERKLRRDHLYPVNTRVVPLAVKVTGVDRLFFAGSCRRWIVRSLVAERFWWLWQ